jgi:hypothetical protein
VCGATVISFTSPWSRASSSRLPPQRWRVTTSPSTEITFAANTPSSITAACASTSLPRSVPAAITVVGCRLAIARAHACGA